MESSRRSRAEVVVAGGCAKLTPMFRLRVVPAQGSPFEHRLRDGGTVIGRSSTSDLVITDRFLSRQHALLNLGRRAAIITGAVLLTLVAAGMASQAAQLLIQADWLPSQYPVWDSSWLVAEQTVTGQLLYALIGYEATPAPLQLFIYAAAILLLIFMVAIFGRLRGNTEVSHA